MRTFIKILFLCGGLIACVAAVYQIITDTQKGWSSLLNYGVGLVWGILIADWTNRSKNENHQ